MGNNDMKGEAGEILAVGQVCIEFEVEGDEIH